MGGKLLKAPVDLTQPNLRVLDSGTAQALWPTDLASVLAPTAVVVGTHIAPQHKEEWPANLEPTTHSIFEEWRASRRGNFDVVHERFVLAACPDDAKVGDTVKKLFAYVRLGGWIKLHEGNMVDMQEGPQHPAMTKFRDIMVGAWAGIGQLPDPGPRLHKWLVAAGAIDIQEELQIIKVGAAVVDKEDGESPLRSAQHSRRHEEILRW